MMAALAAEPSAGADLRVRRLPVAGFLGLAEAFADLSARALEANPHLQPASVAAAARMAGPGAIVVFTAWQAERLMGAWAFNRHAGPETGGVSVLRTPLVPLYEVLAAPVLDRDLAEGALAAMLAGIAADPDLPKMIMARTLPLEGPTWQVLDACLAKCGRRLDVTESWVRGITLPRPGEAPEAAIDRAHGSSRKKRRTQWRALARLGHLNFDEVTGEAARAALDDFFALEAAGWKGKAGTALLGDPQGAAWMRQLAASLAGAGTLRIGALRLDGRPAAMGILLEQDGVVLFLKTAFDEALARYSPGLHLEIEVTRAALARGGLLRFDCGAGDDVDPAAHIWAERRRMGHALIALDNRPLHALPVLASRARAGLRQLRNRWRD